jgi:hypothetical protein
MASELPTQILDVYAVDEETEDETLIGKIQYDPDGQLTLIQTKPDQEAFLENVVETMNAKESLVEKVAPPPDSEETFGLHSKVFERTDEDFLGAMQRYLRAYYGLSLS